MAKLGFFDSGIGGLTVMRSFESLYPDFDMVYFGDRANCPYGNKSPEDIFKLVLSGVEFLIAQGATIIILACNTAVSHAVWRLQNEVYPEGSGIKILGITLPGAEKVKEGGFNSVCVLATSATVLSGAYQRRVKILSPNTHIQEIALPGLVDEIEKNPKIEEILQNSAIDTEVYVNTFKILGIPLTATEFLKKITKEGNQTENKNIAELLEKELAITLPTTEAIVLGCTHYPLVEKEITVALKKFNITHGTFIDPGECAAEKFSNYLQRHPEFTPSQNAQRHLFFSYT